MFEDNKISEILIELLNKWKLKQTNINATLWQNQLEQDTTLL